MSTSSRFVLSKNCLLVGVALLLLSACASQQFISLDRSLKNHAPNASGSTELTTGSASQQPDTHLVLAGENLYAISLKYSLDYRLLASYNAISPPYTIYPGQRLRLTAADSSTVTRPVASQDISAGQVNNQQSSDTVSQNSAAVSPVMPPVSPAKSVTNGNWLWPHPGSTQRPPASALATRTGIDILGQRGDAVVATQDARVVFAGSGLRGYGNLIILQHSANWLSAYAHLSRIDVVEGMEVKAGDKIAEMGERESRALLHFDLRQEGKAVDPLQFLPQR